MTARKIPFGPASIGSGQPPLIVAELSGNHNQSLDRALALVDAAADAGAHAVKIQTYTADTMTLPIATGEFVIGEKDSLWHGRTLHDLYREAQTPYEWHAPIFERCAKRGVAGFSAPFDETAVDFLETLGVPGYKIASFEVTDIALLRKVAKTGKPVIVSTGMASLEEIAEAVATLRAEGCQDIVLLKCTSTYPASPENSNLRTIADLAGRFGCFAGLSDHTMGIGVALASVALGAVLIEKHFTLARADGGVDSAFSIEPAELRSLVTESARGYEGLGAVRYGATAAEKNSLRYRRSLYIVEDVAAGAVLTRENVRAIRPGLGLSPRHLDDVLGKRTRSAVKRGTALSWELVEA